MPSAKPSRCEYGTGSITWLSPRRARLRVRVHGETGQRTKVVRVAPKDKGGIGEAKAELEKVCRRPGRWDSDRENDGHGERNAPGIPGPLQEGRAYAIDH